MKDDVRPLRGSLCDVRDEDDLAALGAQRLGADPLRTELANRVDALGEGVSGDLIDLRHHLGVAVVEHLVCAGRLDEVEVARRGRRDDLIARSVCELDGVLADRGCSQVGRASVLGIGGRKRR